uniref:Putative secreted protein n=1 Tax=Anopheles darlingi TaxID=43151 RepID=A0A2M4DNQ6_ANODA
MRRTGAPMLAIFVLRWRLLAGNLTIHKAGQPHIAFAEAATVVRSKRYLHLVVHVEPLGMVVHLFRLQGHRTHERPGLVEVGEQVLLVDRVAILHQLPSGIVQQRLQLLRTLGIGQLR